MCCYLSFLPPMSGNKPIVTKGLYYTDVYVTMSSLYYII